MFRMLNSHDILRMCLLFDGQARQILRCVIHGRIELRIILKIGVRRHVGDMLLCFILPDYFWTKNFLFEPVVAFVDLGSPTVSIVVILGRYFLQMEHRRTFFAALD